VGARPLSYGAEVSVADVLAFESLPTETQEMARRVLLHEIETREAEIISAAHEEGHDDGQQETTELAQDHYHALVERLKDKLDALQRELKALPDDLFQVPL
jgi:flagellar biosynthesis/type III secretory pathway protein FliH